MMNQPSPQDTNWPKKHIWKTKIPQKVACFTWLLAQEVVLTHENWIKRKWTLCSRCFFMWKGGGNSWPSIFSHCRIIDQLWKIFINFRGIAWTMPRKITEALFSWELVEAGVDDRGRSRMVLHAFGGQFGEKGTLNVLKTAAIHFRRSNSTVSYFSLFGQSNLPWRYNSYPRHIRFLLGWYIGLLSFAHLYTRFQYNQCTVLCLIHSNCYLLKKKKKRTFWTKCWP